MAGGHLTAKGEICNTCDGVDYYKVAASDVLCTVDGVAIQNVGECTAALACIGPVWGGGMYSTCDAANISCENYDGYDWNHGHALVDDAANDANAPAGCFLYQFNGNDNDWDGYWNIHPTGASNARDFRICKSQ